MAQGERRRAARIPVGDRLNAEIVGVKVPITLVNIGPGGFAVASGQWLPSLTRPEFKFTSADKRLSCVFEARMSFTLLQPRRSGPFKDRYITGFAFREPAAPAVRKKILELLELVTNVPA